MHILLVRHGETIHNVAGVYAGITDSPLTSHGVVQAERLGQYLSTRNITNIFSSDLSRAVQTAQKIVNARNGVANPKLVLQTQLCVQLREQDMGSFELMKYGDRESETISSSEGFRDTESKDEMRRRTTEFVQEWMLPLIQADVYEEGGASIVNDDRVIVIVAHGIILRYVWQSILDQLPGHTLRTSPSLNSGDRQFLSWGNTGYLEAEIQSGEPTANVILKAVDSRSHLVGLKKTGGGIGRLEHDPKQKSINNFFKKKA